MGGATDDLNLVKEIAEPKQQYPDSLEIILPHVPLKFGVLRLLSALMSPPAIISYLASALWLVALNEPQQVPTHQLLLLGLVVATLATGLYLGQHYQDRKVYAKWFSSARHRLLNHHIDQMSEATYAFAALHEGSGHGIELSYRVGSQVRSVTLWHDVQSPNVGIVLLPRPALEIDEADETTLVRFPEVHCSLTEIPPARLRRACHYGKLDHATLSYTGAPIIAVYGADNLELVSRAIAKPGS